MTADIKAGKDEDTPKVLRTFLEAVNAGELDPALRKAVDAWKPRAPRNKS